MQNLPEDYHHLAHAFEGTGQHDSAFHYMRLSYEARDSLFSFESEQQMSRLRTEYETQKNLDQIEILNKDKERQSIIIAFAIGFLLLMVIILFLVARSNKIRKESNILLTATNQTLSQQKSEIEAQKETIEIQNDPK